MGKEKEISEVNFRFAPTLKGALNLGRSLLLGRNLSFFHPLESGKEKEIWVFNFHFKEF